MRSICRGLYCWAMNFTKLQRNLTNKPVEKIFGHFIPVRVSRKNTLKNTKKSSNYSRNSIPRLGSITAGTRYIKNCINFHEPIFPIHFENFYSKVVLIYNSAKNGTMQPGHPHDSPPSSSSDESDTRHRKKTEWPP